MDIDWESSQHTSMSFCVSHYSKIERFLTCALCKRRLARNHTHQLANTETDELNQLLGQQGIPVLLSAGTFVCKLCRYFTQLQLKYKDVENMNTNHKSFFKNYRKRYNFFRLQGLYFFILISLFIILYIYLEFYIITILKFWKMKTKIRLRIISRKTKTKIKGRKPSAVLKPRLQRLNLQMVR